MSADQGDDDRGEDGQGPATRRAAIAGLLVILLLVVVGYFLWRRCATRATLRIA